MKDEHVVVFRVGSMGDTVVALPCFHKIRETFPNAHITLLANYPVSSKAASMMAVLGDNSAFVDDVIYFKTGLKNPFLALKLILKLRKFNSPVLIYLRSKPSKQMLRRDAIFFKLAGFRDIRCVPSSDDMCFSRVDPISNELEPEAFRLARSINSLGLINFSNTTCWDLCLTSAELSEGDRLSVMMQHPFVVIHAATKEKARDWGLENWIKLVKSLKNSSNAKSLAIIGAASDSDRASKLLDVWGEEGFNLCGGPSPREVAALLQHAALFVGHDSGPLHLTQCVGTPAVGLFGSVNLPKRWHPVGNHARIIHNLRGTNCIPVEQVLQESLSVLNSRE